MSTTTERRAKDGTRRGMNANSAAGRKPFKPGQSGNPSGRPKKHHALTEKAREHAETAIEVLTKIAEDETAPAAARISACNILLDRAFGKPTSHISADVRTSLNDELENHIRHLNGLPPLALQAKDDLH